MTTDVEVGRPRRHCRRLRRHKRSSASARGSEKGGVTVEPVLRELSGIVPCTVYRTPYTNPWRTATGLPTVGLRVVSYVT